MAIAETLVSSFRSGQRGAVLTPGDNGYD